MPKNTIHTRQDHRGEKLILKLLPTGQIENKLVQHDLDGAGFPCFRTIATEILNLGDDFYTEALELFN